MDLRSPLGLLDAPPEPQNVGPRLLLELEPRTSAFFGNVRDRFLFRTVPDLSDFPTGDFWHDVFVPTRKPWRGITTSAFAHIAAVTAVYGVLQLPMFQSHPQQLVNPFEDRTITYYNVSEYLPPMNTAQAPAKEERKGEPALAKQEILSVPPEADNKRQTIVAAPKVKLASDVPMPNMVMWDKIPVAQPTAASERAISQLQVPRMSVEVISPTADVNSTEAKLTLPSLRPQVIEPEADVRNLSARSAHAPKVAVIEPVAAVDDMRRTGVLNIARPSIDVSAPKLPTPTQQVVSASATGTAPAPPAPSSEGLASTHASGQLVSLSLIPANITGPVQAPAGTRSGTFSSGPSGKEGAPGTPSLHAGGSSDGGAGKTEAHEGPPGISIGAAPSTPGVNSKPVTLNDAQRQILLATLKKPPLPPPGPTPKIDTPSSGLEDRVFGGKKFYSMVLNMPNLTSRSGSWVIKFAELKPTDVAGELLGPVATQKVDPAYPPDLVRDRVEGTVVLYAVIHSDGRVGEVKILSGIDDRLDQNAIRALLRWHFQPATKNGQAVALEALVQIPFRVSSPF